MALGGINQDQWIGWSSLWKTSTGGETEKKPAKQSHAGPKVSHKSSPCGKEICNFETIESENELSQ